MRLGNQHAIVICSVVFGCFLGLGGISTTFAQETYGLGITAANCEQLPTSGPFIGGGCVVAEVSVEVTDEDGNFLGSCTTSGVDGGRAGGCTVEVDYGIVAVVTLDESTIPDGYYLSSENPQVVQVPDTEPDGEDSGPIFINLLSEDMVDFEDDSETAAVDELPNTGAGQPSEAGISLIFLISGILFLTGLLSRSSKATS